MHKDQELYVASATEFDSLEEAEEQIQRWARSGQIKHGTKVYRVTKIYQPEIKLVEEEE